MAAVSILVWEDVAAVSIPVWDVSMVQSGAADENLLGALSMAKGASRALKWLQ